MMRINKKGMMHYLPLMAAAVLMLVSSLVVTADVAPVEVREAAQAGLCDFVTRGLPGEIVDNADLTGAELGLGFPIYTVSSAKLQNDLESPIHAMATPTIEWYFMVTVNRRPVALLTVAFFEGKWKTVAIGDTGLSKEVAVFTDVWGKKKGLDLRFIRVFEAKSDLLEVRRGNRSIGYLPFESARVAFNLKTTENKPVEMLTDAQILEPLRQRVKEVLQKDFIGTDSEEVE